MKKYMGLLIAIVLLISVLPTFAQEDKTVVIHAQDSYDYSGNNSIEEVIFQEGVEIVDKNSFENCTGLKRVVFPKSLRRIEDEAFENCTSLTEIVFPENADFTIGFSAFEGCRTLKVLEFKGSVFVLNSAFVDCTGLEKIVFPEEGLVNLRPNAFYGCTALTELDLKNVTLSDYGIMNNPFEGCDNIKKVTMGKNVSAVFDDLGLDGTRLWNSFPDSVEHIDVLDENELYKSVDGVVFTKDMKELLFYPQSKVCEVYSVPEGVEKVSGRIGGTTGAVVILPEGVKSAGICAFNNVKELYIPKSFEKLQSRWQRDGRGAKMMYSLPNGIDNIYYQGSVDDWKQIQLNSNEAVLKNTVIHYNYEFLPQMDEGYLSGEEFEYKGLKYKYTEGTFTLMGSADKNAEGVYVPSNLNGISVKINDCAFEGCVYLETVTLSPGVENIPFGAFANCISLKNINLENVRNVGNEAFLNCHSLDNVKLEKIETWGENVFGGCVSLTTVTVNYSEYSMFPLFANGDGIKTIYMHSVPYAENELKDTKAVIYGFTDEVKHFAQKNELTFVEGYEEAIISDKFVYSNCEYEFKDGLLTLKGLAKHYVEDVVIPSAINGYNVVIEKNAFKNETSIKKVYLGEGIKEIPFAAFLNCTSLEYINLENIEKLGDSAFANCDSLTEVTLLNINYWHGARYYDVDLVKKKAPYLTNTSPREPFKLCDNLTKITIKWPENYLGNDTVAEQESSGGYMQGFFPKCVKEIHMLNAPKNPYPYEHMDFEVSYNGDVKSVQKIDGIVVYSDSLEVEAYAKKKGLNFVKTN